MAASIETSKTALGGQANCNRVGLPASSPEIVMNQAVRGKPKLQWRIREVSDARNMELLPRKAVGNEQGQSNREAI